MKKFWAILLVIFFFNIPIYANTKQVTDYNSLSPSEVELYIKQIPTQKLPQYKIELDKILNHLLDDKITYEQKTLEQMLLDYSDRADLIFFQYLKDKTNKEKNEEYLIELRRMYGTISLYSDAIIEELLPVIEKYQLDIVPGTGADTYFYEYYVKPYNVSRANDFKNLINLKDITYEKIYNYVEKIHNLFY